MHFVCLLFHLGCWLFSIQPLYTVHRVIVHLIIHLSNTTLSIITSRDPYTSPSSASAAEVS